jgi:hypothetical protein
MLADSGLPQKAAERIEKMAASRTVHKGIYASDILATNFTRRVDDHFYTQTAALGWSAPIGGELPVPTGMRPRHAVGIDTSGRRHTVVVADITADLWTRTTLNWSILDDAGALDTVTLTGLVGEAMTF